jgi:hypothetical protein
VHAVVTVSDALGNAATENVLVRLVLGPARRATRRPA